MNKQKISIYLGLTSKDKKEVINLKNALLLINTQMSRYNINGYNVIEQTGFYKSEKEESLNISFIDTEDNLTEKRLLNLIKDLKDIFNQDCVLFEKQFAECNFI